MPDDRNMWLRLMSLRRLSGRTLRIFSSSLVKYSKVRRCGFVVVRYSALADTFVMNI